MERVVFLIVFYITFSSEEKETENSLPPIVLVRMCIFDIVICGAFIVFSFIVGKKAVVNKFNIVSIVVYGFCLAMIISMIFHAVYFFTGGELGTFRIVATASFALTEGFNTFLVLLYRFTCADLIAKYNTNDELANADEENLDLVTPKPVV